MTDNKNKITTFEKRFLLGFSPGGVIFKQKLIKFLDDNFFLSRPAHCQKKIKNVLVWPNAI